jgi:hypothetical protein
MLQFMNRHSREGGNPRLLSAKYFMRNESALNIERTWIPACAGMTEFLDGDN